MKSEVIGLVIALSFVAITAMAQDQSMTPQQQQDYIGILFSDRVQQLIAIDKLKIQVEDLKRQLAAEQAHQAAVDKYWKDWVGDKK